METLSSVQSNASHKRAKFHKLLHIVDDTGSADSQVALLLLRQCGSFCKMLHLARSTPSLNTADALQMLDNDFIC